MSRVTHPMRETLWRSAAGQCHYCSTPLRLEDFTVDHIVPVAFKGPDSMWNLVASCETCNGGHGDRVRKCACQRCARAVDRFHKVKKANAALSVPKQSDAVSPSQPRSMQEVQRVITAREGRLRWRLAQMDDVNTYEAAALRGAASAFAQVLQLLPVDPVCADILLRTTKRPQT